MAASPVIFAERHFLTELMFFQDIIEFGLPVSVDNVFNLTDNDQLLDTKQDIPGYINQRIFSFIKKNDKYHLNFDYLQTSIHLKTSIRIA